jgi:hypothetical protein
MVIEFRGPAVGVAGDSLSGFQGAVIFQSFLTSTLKQKEPQSPLFLAALGKTDKLSRRPLVRTDVRAET